MNKRKDDIKRLAKFMGDVIEISAHTGNVYWPDGSRWDPSASIEDAMTLAEKIKGLKLYQKKDARWVAFFTPSRGAFGFTPAEAITLAALAYLDATEKKL